ncbi:GNAT family N-acetyltransferase [Halobaculum lipolyticum]|uniref:GNAT family N-acetyltransferase n=1 Tax=Halobaculum lipolyticum TaxID=3032001 RepID=A0ABD5W8P3_9EURY|nr:GNAT family N-acetyltransferase [Halobaculum sp. DT31]
MEIRRLSLAEWSDALPDDGFEVFHTPEALDALAAHANGDLRLYGGFKGERPVGLAPVFVRTQAIGTAALSPPPGFGIPRLGPLVMPASPKQRKRERVNGRFTEGLLEELDVGASTTLFRMVCPTSYPDPRPFGWSALSMTPSFTYHLPVTADTDAMLKSFSKSLRREITDAEELDVSVEVGGRDAVRRIYEQARDRYDEQDRTFSLTWPYVRDLTDALSGVDRCRPYVVRDGDGDFRSGIVVLYSNDAAYFWLGGAIATVDGTAVNSLIHWRIVEDIAAGEPRESVDTYDLMGANTERICQYKSKFGAELVPYYTVESEGAGMRAAKTAYRLLSQ